MPCVKPHAIIATPFITFFGFGFAALSPTVIPQCRRVTMKPMNLWTGFLALGLMLGSPAITSRLLAQTQKPQAQQQPDQKKTETFTGQVIKTSSGQYALLMDAQAGRGHYLDDQEKAKQFEGKNVKVTGYLEVAKNLIHVSEIQPV